MSRLGALSRAGESGPRLLIWPEAAVTEPLQDERRHIAYQHEAEFVRRVVQTQTEPSDLLLTGGISVQSNDGVRATGGDQQRLRDRGRTGGSSAATTRRISSPMANICRCGRCSRRSACRGSRPATSTSIPGPGPQTLDLPGVGPVGFQLCYEIIFSGEVVDRARRPAFLFNPSNDAWFGAWGPPQHLAQARLRALEEGLPVVRSTPTGISAIVDAHGRLLHSIPLGQMGRDRRPPAARRAADPVRALRQSAAPRLRASARRGGDCSRAQSALGPPQIAHKDIFMSDIKFPALPSRTPRKASLMRSNYLFTSESVSEGHPDKVADQISDAVVDLFIGRDPEARVACETLVTTNRIVLAGEVRCRSSR